MAPPLQADEQVSIPYDSPVVLDCIVGPARQQLCYRRPLIPMHLVGLLGAVGQHCAASLGGCDGGDPGPCPRP